METSPASRRENAATTGFDPEFDRSSLQAIADAIPTAVFVFQDDHNIYVNAAAAALTGFTSQELVGMAFWEVIDPEWRDRIRSNGRARQQGEAVPLSYEVPLRRRDGRRCWVQFAGHRIVNRGRPAVLGIAFDITSRKEMEEWLRADPEHDRSLFEHCPDALLVEDFSAVRCRLNALRDAGVDDFAAYFNAHPEVVRECAASVRVTDVNSAGLQLYGATSKQELEAGLSRLLLAPPAVDLWRRELLAWAAGAAKFEDETASMTLAGEPIHVWIRCAVAPGSEASLTRLFVWVKNVTRERRAAAALRSSEERYKVLYENMPAMYFTLDPGGTVLEVNEFGARQLGYEPAALIGKSVLSVFHPEDRAAVLQRLQDANRSGERVESWELRKVRRDGSIMWVRESVRRLAECGNFLMLCEDVTERRSLEERILGIGESERERVAEELHDDLGQRLSGLAYQIRAQQLRLQEAANPEAAKAAEIAGYADDALARLRSLSHVMSGIDVPARGLASSLQELAEFFASIHEVRCSVRCDPRVRLDEATYATDLYRIVQEALTNAVRHGHARSIEISLSIEDGCIGLRVVDDGRASDQDARGPVGMGLRNMRYRATRLGAAFKAGTVSEGGFEVAVTLPAAASKPRP